MATTYNSANDPWGNSGDQDPETFGTNGATITKSDTVDLNPYPKAVVVTAAGNLVILPLKAADDGAHTITFTSVPVGFIPPYRVRRVFATGSTATAATIDR